MDKGMGILEAVTRMANIMGLRMIAEGVETEDQINYLLNMGCIYGQGYFFYKPLPVEEIKALLNDENNVDYRGIQARKIEHIRFKELFQSALASDSIPVSYTHLANNAGMSSVLPSIALSMFTIGEFEKFKSMPKLEY